MASHLLDWDALRHQALKNWLSGQDVSVLVEFLMESARNDDVVRVVLRCLAEYERPGLHSHSLLPETIRFLTSVPDPKMDRTHQSDQVQHRLNWMLFLLGTILDQRNPEGVVEAAELASERSEILAMEELDSEYWADSVRGELRRLHRLACERTRPDAVALAVRWAWIRRSSKLGWHEDFLDEYVDFLGADGLVAHELAMQSYKS